MQKLSSFILKRIGWKIVGITDLPSKCIICVAPHTSNWDLLLGKLIYLSLGRKSYFLIKKTWFFFPMNLLFNAMGGIPVDRSKKTSLTEQMTSEFSQRDDFQLAITPEGTRSKNAEWKRGFYYIATAANVPIVVAILDYKDKTAYFDSVFAPTGDADKDIAEIQDRYKNANGKHQEKFSSGNEQ